MEHDLVHWKKNDKRKFWKCTRCEKTFTYGEPRKPDCPVMLETEVVKEMVGGEFPHALGFNWGCVTHFEWDNGVLHPMEGDELAPGPSFVCVITEMLPIHGGVETLKGQQR